MATVIDRPASSSGKLEVGTEVQVALFPGKRTLGLSGKIVAQVPLVMQPTQLELPEGPFPIPANVFWRDGDTLMQGEGIAVDRVETDSFSGLALRLTHTGDYRTSLESRVSIQVPIMIRPVASLDETYAGVTETLGDRGSLLRLPFSPPIGALVEYQTSLEGELVRGMAVVTQSLARRQSVELAFLRAPGVAHSALTEFLARAA